MQIQMLATQLLKSHQCYVHLHTHVKHDHDALSIIHYHGDNIVSTLTVVLRSYIWLLGNH